MPGYHLHFITEDFKHGGHLLEFVVENATIAVDRTPRFRMLLPPENSDFYKKDFSKDLSKELNKAEK